MRAEIDRHELPASVDRLMASPAVTIGPDDDLAHAAQLFGDHRFHHLLVVEDERLVGVLSERDVLAAALSSLTSDRGRRERHLAGVAVRRAMSGPPVFAHPATTFIAAAELLLKHRFSCLPIVDGGKILGVVTITDLVRLSAELLKRQSSPLRVADLKTPRPVVTSLTTDHLDVAQVLLRHEHVRHLPVLDGAGHVVGVLTDRDMLAALRSRLEASSQGDRMVHAASHTVAEAMSQPPVLVSAEALAATAVERMLHLGVRALPVMRGRRLVGIFTETDVLSWATTQRPA